MEKSTLHTPAQSSSPVAIPTRRYRPVTPLRLPTTVRHTFSLVFKTVGSQTISVTDATNELYNLDWGISVRPAAAAALVVSGIPIKPSRVSRRT